MPDWTRDLTSNDLVGLLDAKGDLITASADNTPSLLSVGANGEFLTPKSSNSNGLEWVGMLTYGGQVLTKNGDVLIK